MKIEFDISKEDLINITQTLEYTEDDFIAEFFNRVLFQTDKQLDKYQEEFRDLKRFNPYSISRTN